MQLETHRVIGRRMSYLLVAVILLFIYLLQEVENSFPGMDIVFAILILATVYVAGSDRRWLTVAILLAIGVSYIVGEEVVSEVEIQDFVDSLDDWLEDITAS